MDLAPRNMEAIEIGFSCLYDRLAHNFQSINLSRYTLVDLMLASTLGDGALSLACPNTSSPPYRYSSKIILPAILEDQPLETTKVEAELDSFTKELNEVLTMD